MLQYTTQIQTKNSNLRNSIGPKPGFFNNNKNISKKLIEREQGGARACGGRWKENQWGVITPTRLPSQTVKSLTTGTSRICFPM